MATPTFNKYKSTTIFGNLSVKDLTNSLGTSVVEVASVDLSGNFLSRGDSTFTKKVVCNALLADINANNILTTKQYVDSVAGGGGDVTLAGTNAFTGNNSFNQNLPTSTLTPTTSTQLTTKAYVDSVSGVTLAGTNAFTGNNSFNQNLPTSTQSPTTSTQLTTKAYVDSVAGGGVTLAGTNAFTGNNSFNSNLPTSTQTPTTSTQLTTKTFVDSAISTAISGLSTVYSTIANEVKTNTANAFTSTNSFNQNLPTSTLTPTTSTQLTTKTFVDSAISTAISGLSTVYSTLTNEVKTNTANAFTSTNSFNNNLPTSTLTPTTSTQLATKAYVDSVAGGGSVSLALNNNFTGINQFQAPDFIYNYTATEVTSQGNFKVIEDLTKTQYFIFTCNGSPSFQTTISIPTTTTMNYLCVGSGGRGSGGNGVIGTGGGGGAISHGSFVMVGGTTYTITVGTIAGSGLANLSSIVGGTVNIVANGGKDGNSGTSPVNFTGVIATASATGVITSTNINGTAGGQGRNDALTPNGSAGNSFPFRYNTATNSIIVTPSLYGSAGAGTKSGATGSTGGGFDAGGIAGGSANNQGGSGTALSGGGGGATSLTSQAGGAGSGIVIIYFTPSTFIDATGMENGIIVADKIVTPVLNINTSTTLNKIRFNTVLFTGGSAITFTLPASGMVVDGDTLLLRKTSATAYVITIAAQGGVLTQMLNTNNTTVALPSTTIFAGTVFQLRLVARKTVGSFSQVIWLIC